MQHGVHPSRVASSELIELGEPTVEWNWKLRPRLQAQLPKLNQSHVPQAFTAGHVHDSNIDQGFPLVDQLDVVAYE